MSLILTAIFLPMIGTISPGPDCIMCIRNSLMYSRRIGIMTAIGFSLGVAVHVAYCIAGVGLIISQSIILFSIIKWIGALYLIYIGIMSWRSKHSKIVLNIQKNKQTISDLQGIKIGFLTNILNPKATLFFLSVFTVAISPDTSKTVLILVGIWSVLWTFLWFSFVATVLTVPHVRLVFERFQGFFNKFFG